LALASHVSLHIHGYVKGHRNDIGITGICQRFFMPPFAGEINTDDTLRFSREKSDKPTAGQSPGNLTLPFERAYA
jgi:hypothetical protein